MQGKLARRIGRQGDFTRYLRQAFKRAVFMTGLKWNSTKFKVLFTMATWAQDEGHFYRSASVLAKSCGVNLHSLRHLLPKWTRWHYVHRKLSPEGIYVYSTAPHVKTARFLNWFMVHHPRECRIFLDEMAEHRKALMSRFL